MGAAAEGISEKPRYLAHGHLSPRSNRNDVVSYPLLLKQPADKLSQIGDLYRIVGLFSWRIMLFNPIKQLAPSLIALAMSVQVTRPMQINGSWRFMSV
jgi:hypothetical protein